MKNLIFALAVWSTSFAANAQYVQDACSGRFNGMWAYAGGVPMTVVLQPGWRGRTEITIYSDYSRETFVGNCRYYNDGSADLVFRGRYYDGRLTIYRYGGMQGSIEGYNYRGRRADDYPPPPPPPPPRPPRPEPPYPPQPPPPPPHHDNNICLGQVDGTWYFKGGRGMSLFVNSSRTDGRWSPYVEVIISQANGSENTRGECRLNADGSARLVFRGSANSGDVNITPYREVNGVVSGFQFTGRFVR